MAYISLVSTTENSITVKVGGLNTIYQYSGRSCSWYLDGDTKNSWTTSIGAHASESKNFTFSGLEAGTTYEISGIITGSHETWTNDVYLSAISATTDKKQIYIEEWSWFQSNYNASYRETVDAYNAVTGQGKLTDFSFLVWNDLVYKVRDIINDIDDSWSNMYATLNDTLMDYSDKRMTARRFNALRQNVGRHYSTGIAEVSPGDIIYGSYFTDLTDKINEWINYINNNY